jgi:hypothetical protein
MALNMLLALLAMALAASSEFHHWGHQSCRTLLARLPRGGNVSASCASAAR